MSEAWFSDQPPDPGPLPQVAAGSESSDADLALLEFDPEREATIEPARVVKPHPDMPEGCVLCFFQDVVHKLVEGGEAAAVAELRTEFARHPIYALQSQGRRVALLHPGVGAPLAACILEEAIASGGRRFVACGSCGVLDSEIAAGHILLPFSAVRDEGTSFHYLPPGREVRPDPAVVRKLEAVLQRGQREYLLCKTWTTDGVYRETRGRVRRRRQEGCLAVEMEAAALFAVAQFRSVPLGMYLYAGDDVSGEQWDDRDWFRRRAVREALLWLAVEACLELESE